MTQADNTLTSPVLRHRNRATARGCRRVEVTIPGEDARLIKAIARTLRDGGSDAEQVRSALRPLVAAAKAATGPELLRFLRNAPGVDSALDIERDRSTGRPVDLA